MDKDFFKKTRILDGGMGQELLNRGLKPKGTLWSAHALIDKECHQMVIDAHLDFINAGAEVIVTTTFTARRNRLIQNDCEKYFEKINIKAVELAQKARDISKKEVLIAGGLPNQKQTYSADLGEDLDLIEKNFYDQAKLLKNGIDFFYLDVMSSGLECEIALKTIESFNLPVLPGVHVRDNGQLPSGETIKDIVKKYGHGKVSLWDYALYSPYTVTPEPIRNNKTKLKGWFWEPSHYKEELGDRMLSDIFSLTCSINQYEPVGIKLNNVNIDEHLSNQQNQRSILLATLATEKSKEPRK